MPMFQWCRNILLQAVTNIRALLNCGRGSLDTLEGTMLSLELIYREFTAAEILEGGLHSHEYEAMHFVKHAYETLRDIYERGVSEDQGAREHVAIRLDVPRQSTTTVIPAPQPETYPSELVTRPKFVIPHTQLLYLIENRFTIARIAKMLGVSERTIYRRMAEFGYSVNAQYADLTDDDLCILISEIQEEFPMCGNRQMAGYLLSRGFRVQQSRIRETQRQISPEGTIMRRLKCLHRRRYSVASPRSLYHIDGNHKLIR